MSGVLEVVEATVQNASTAVSLLGAIATWRQWRASGTPTAQPSQNEDEPRPLRANHRGVSLAARLTGDSERYAEEWAAEWHDLPKRPRRIRAMYAVRISARAIPIGVIAWSRKRRKA
ncbi:hypothetical protein ACIRTB_20870 [Streptomyces sp. NPDC101158]|uniref:hypothetical protein n=1 Tax=Streptomyces sp. NPDC101158 TaxID=3366117 RepID=UPI0038033C29